ncbi:MAG TPA: DNA-3-methyladenine glycosylase [Pirellulales bacterium]|nr:DNA-3-methyladenine glycosylase [Pirellulales bacterium]
MPRNSALSEASKPGRTRHRKLRRAFFARPAIDVAQDLIGKILVHRLGDGEFRGRIVETEAYVGPHDLASHSSKGRTKRTEIMFGPPGYAYVYLIYGMYDMLNVVVGKKGDAQAVLLRGAEPLGDWDAHIIGPGRLARAFGVTRAHNGVDLTQNDLFFLDDPRDRPKLRRTKRIGVDYAGEWKDALLRFVDADCAALRR